MSVVGIDFGAQSTKIGVARNKGIDIVGHLSVGRNVRLTGYRSPMRLPIDKPRMFISILVLIDC
jgi:hypothetical protein